MTDSLGLIWILLLFALGSWGLAQLLVPLLLRLQGPVCHPRVMRRRLGLLAQLPWLMPMLAATAMLLLAWAKQMDWVHDHCTGHLQHHPHFCLEHLPQLMLDYTHSLFVVMLVIAIAGPFVRLVMRFHAVAQRLLPIRQMSRGAGPLLRVDDERPLGFAAGIRRPKIFLSRGIARVLDKREQRILLAHEIAHIRHRDLLHSAALDVLLCLHLPWAARNLRQRWSEAMEAMADEQVAQRFERSEVAAVLLKLVRHAMQAPSAASATGSDVVQRIERLLMPAPALSKPIFEMLFLAGLFCFLVGAMTGHHALETLLGWALSL